MNKKKLLIIAGSIFIVLGIGRIVYYNVFPITRQSDRIGYYAPCWGKDNKIYFIKSVTYAKEIINPMALLSRGFFGGGNYLPEKTEVYLCSMNYDGTEKKEIVKIGDTDDNTYWLPMYLDYCQANNLILLSGGIHPARGETYNGIYTIGIDGNNMTRLSDVGLHASWSADGKKIVYQVHEWKTERDKRGIVIKDEVSDTIWVMSSNGSNKKMISKAKEKRGEKRFGVIVIYDDTSPIWSPKGDLIAFVSNGWIWVMKPDGSERRKVSKGHLTDWSPDGTMLLGSIAGGSAIFDLEGNVVKRLKYCGEWSPDGKTILGCLGTYDIESGVEKHLLADITDLHKKEHFIYKKPNNIW